MKLIVMKLFSPHFEWSVCVCVCVEGKRAIDKMNSTGWSLNWFQMDYWFANIAQLVAAHGFPSGHWISIRDTDYYSDNRNRIKLGINCVSPCVEPLLHPPRQSTTQWSSGKSTQKIYIGKSVMFVYSINLRTAFSFSLIILFSRWLFAYLTFSPKCLIAYVLPHPHLTLPINSNRFFILSTRFIYLFQ